MEYLEYLYAFGLGISFIAGAMTLFILVLSWIGKQKKNMHNEIIEQNKIIEARLINYVENTGRIADALESIADRYGESHDRYRKLTMDAGESHGGT